MIHNAFLSGCNVLAYEKEDVKYGMTFAWGGMLDYGLFGILIGEQSDTGNNIKIGDVVGISCLAKGQENICMSLGKEHSSSFEKFSGIAIEKQAMAILIKGSKVKIICKVEQDIKIEKNSKDHFFVLREISSFIDSHKEYLSCQQILGEK